jgi:hypothetical protein
LTNQRHRHYWDKKERMDKAETQLFLRPDTEWTNQRLRQALRQGTENEQARYTSIIETRHRIDKPTNQRHVQH